jgi:hypothetical protein
MAKQMNRTIDDSPCRYVLHDHFFKSNNFWKQQFIISSSWHFEKWAEAGHILYLRILYPIHIQAPKKDIISYHYHGKKKDMDIYPISFVKNFALSQFLNNKKPDLVALQHTSTRLFTGLN